MLQDQILQSWLTDTGNLQILSMLFLALFLAAVVALWRTRRSAAAAAAAGAEREAALRARIEADQDGLRDQLLIAGRLETRAEALSQRIGELAEELGIVDAELVEHAHFLYDAPESRLWCMAYSASVLAQQRHRPNLSHTSFHAMARRGIPSLQLRQAVAKPLHTSFLFCSVFISRAHIRSMRIFGTSKAASSRASCQGHLSWPLRMN